MTSYDVTNRFSDEEKMKEIVEKQTTDRRRSFFFMIDVKFRSYRSIDKSIDRLIYRFVNIYYEPRKSFILKRFMKHLELHAKIWEIIVI